MKRKEIGKLYLLQVSFAHFLRGGEVPSSLPLPHLTLATVTVRVILLRNPTLAKDLLLGKLIAPAPKVKKSAPQLFGSANKSRALFESGGNIVG